MLYSSRHDINQEEAKIILSEMPLPECAFQASEPSSSQHEGDNCVFITIVGSLSAGYMR